MPQTPSLPTTAKTPFFVESAKATRAVLNGLPATKILTKEDSGSLILFDRAAGIVVTLPAPVIGLDFEFIVSVTVTSNSYKIITDAGTTLIVGQYLNIDTDTSSAMIIFPANGSTHIALTMNGSTTGGLIGSSFRLRCISATQWLIEGVMNGSGTVATAFATS